MSPVPVYHFIQEEERFERRLIRRLEICQEALLASAFFTMGALEALKPAMLQALDHGAKITFLLGRFDFVTQPRAVDDLLKLSAKYPAQLVVSFDADFGFHYKLALFKVEQRPVVIIGSSNLTPKGLGAVGEINLEIVGNRGVFRRATDILERRLELAIPAEEHIDEYRRRYDRAERYRQQRKRWENLGRRKLSVKKPHRDTLLKDTPEGSTFTFWWIGSHERDKTLLRNIRKEYDQAHNEGESFPYQWTLANKAEGHFFKEGKHFVVADDFGHCFGFVICTRKFLALNSQEREQWVIFYRFRRGWKAQFPTKTEAWEKLRELGIAENLTVIKAKLSKRLKEYLRKKAE